MQTNKENSLAWDFRWVKRLKQEKNSLPDCAPQSTLLELAMSISCFEKQGLSQALYLVLAEPYPALLGDEAKFAVC